MSAKGLKNHLPDTATLRRKLYHQIGGADRKSNALRRWIRHTVADPMVWHLNRRSLAGGVAVGLFIAWIPLPLQMLMAAVVSAVMRVHVPISVVMVWFTNPLTFAPLFYVAGRSGSMILNKPVFPEPISMSFDSLIASVGQAWPTLLVGLLFCASVTAVIGFLGTLIAWRIFAVRKWRQRRFRKVRTDL